MPNPCLNRMPQVHRRQLGPHVSASPGDFLGVFRVKNRRWACAAAGMGQLLRGCCCWIVPAAAGTQGAPCVVHVAHACAITCSRNHPVLTRAVAACPPQTGAADSRWCAAAGPLACAALAPSGTLRSGALLHWSCCAASHLPCVVPAACLFVLGVSLMPAISAFDPVSQSAFSA